MAGKLFFKKSKTRRQKMKMKATLFVYNLPWFRLQKFPPSTKSNSSRGLSSNSFEIEEADKKKETAITFNVFIYCC